MNASKPDTLRLRTDAIKGAMAVHGITSQEELANILGVGRATVIRAFSGGRPGDALIAGLRLRLNLPLDLIVEAVPAAKTKRLDHAV